MELTISYQINVMPVIRPQPTEDGWAPARLDDIIEITIPFAHKLTASVELHAPIDEDRVEVCRLAVGNYLLGQERAISSDRPVGYHAYSSLPPSEAAEVAIEHLRVILAERTLHDEQLDELARRVLDRYDRLGLIKESGTKMGRPPKSAHKHAKIAALWRQAHQVGAVSVEGYIADRVHDQGGQRPSGNTVRQWVHHARKKGFIPPAGTDVGRVASPHTATTCDHHERAKTA